jgi:ubiquinone/menaquinone biosynthesis C-methylase UbiE
MKQWIKIERIPGPLASSYEKATRMVIETYYRQVAEEIVSRCDKGVILDLGTGPGYLPIQIAKRAPDLKIVGVDLSRKLIQLAKANAQIAGLSDQLTFEVGNSASLRFDDGSFDMVISTGMLHSLKKPISVIQEIHRVLRNDGEAWIYDPAKVASQVDRKKWRASLSLREQFFLWLFKLVGLHRPIATYKRSQVIPMVKATDFVKYWIEERENEIRIKLWK